MGWLEVFGFHNFEEISEFVVWHFTFVVLSWDLGWLLKS